MEFYRNQHFETFESGKPPLSKDIVEIEQQCLFYLTEKICKDKNCRYPQLTLRILNHVIAGIDVEGRMFICARQLAKAMEVNYDTVTKCLKYLREIGVIRFERQP